MAPQKIQARTAEPLWHNTVTARNRPSAAASRESRHRRQQIQQRNQYPQRGLEVQDKRHAKARDDNVASDRPGVTV